MNGKILYFRLLRYVAPYWRMFALAISAMIVLALTDPLLPALLKPLLDNGFVEKDPYFIKLIPFLLIILVIVRGVTTLISSVGITWVASRLVMDLRVAMFGKILTLPTTDFDNTSSGVLLSKVTYDVNQVMAATTDSLMIVIKDSLAIIGLLSWMFYLNWLLSLIVFTIVPLIILVVRIVSRWLRTMNLSIQESMGNMTHILEEAITGHQLVKVFGGQHYENKRFRQACDTVRGLAVKAEMTSSLSVLIIQFLTATALSIIIYVAARQSSSDEITVGGFVSLFTAMGMLFAPIKRLTKVNDKLQQGLAAAHSIFTLIDQVSEPDQGQKTIARLSGKISFKKVHFGYTAQTEQLALQNISLEIQAGETVAFVGASGSGKTTLVNLIPRFYAATQGQILLDEIDICELPLNILRENLALVSQDVVLFNDTVAANIAYGNLAETPQKRIVEAAEFAYALEFIEQMPQKFSTLIGERGVKLSGGQRQRLAIARAFLKNAPILIFDEATSALDNRSEWQVQQSLEKLKEKCTLLIIAHRLSTIAKANRIVVLDKGSIVEMGKHEQLLQQGGIYARLYQASS
ncbi:MAG: lipid A export permease/ATP-binding protein MsbA [Beggiatoa sp. IS2]|nr:MAG: lipid A export permease/ATP-binding protein MsbA [Beggiatoa sp. IS2]